MAPVTTATTTAMNSQAARHHPVIKAFYDQLVARGKLKKVALVACTRKICDRTGGLCQVFGIAKSTYSQSALTPCSILLVDFRNSLVNKNTELCSNILMLSLELADVINLDHVQT
jgi:hypothetical protein